VAAQQFISTSDTSAAFPEERERKLGMVLSIASRSFLKDESMD
jgi:hypothetical protein